MLGTTLLGTFPRLLVAEIELDSGIDKLGIAITIDGDFLADEREYGDIVECTMGLSLLMIDEEVSLLMIKLLDETSTVSDVGVDDKNDVWITRFSKFEDLIWIADEGVEDFIIVLLLAGKAGCSGIEIVDSL